MNIEQARSEVSAIFERTLDAVDPTALVRKALAVTTDGIVVRADDHELPPNGRLIVLAVGKAALPMAGGALDALGHRVTEGIAVTKRGQSDSVDLGPIEIIEASHPVPDETSEAAGMRLLELAEGLRASDIALVLVSGGGSALVEAPGAGIELRDIMQATDLLLRAGADIQTLNAVRRRLSRIKAGGLARACAPARVINLVISDVLGSPLPVIASGLSVDPGRENQQALNWVHSSSVWTELPGSVQGALSATPDSLDGRLDNVIQTEVLADAETAARAAAEAARSLDYRAEILGTRFAGEAREFGRFWSQLSLRVRRTGAPFAPPVCLVGAGETTVTVHGQGVGGRNTEMALAAAIEIAGVDGVAVASLATDGDDGTSGAAGGVVVGDSATAARAQNLSPEAHLVENDSARVLEAVGGLLVTGQTGTNVNDLYLALIP